MKTCSRDELLQRWRRALPELGDGTEIPASAQASHRAFNIETIPVGQGVPMARQLVRWVDAMKNGPLLALVFEWGIWESSESEHLFYVWREWKHDYTMLEDRPGHIFLTHERGDCESLTFMALCFGWGICIGSPSSCRAAFVNYDGNAQLVALDQGAPEQFVLEG